MQTKTHSYLLVAFFLVASLVIFCYKAFFYQLPLTPGESTRAWEIEAQITFDALNKPVKATLYLPLQQANFGLTDEHFISRGYGTDVVSQQAQRFVNWSIRKARGRQTLYYRATAFLAQNTPPEIKPPKLSPTITLEGPELLAAQSIVKNLQSQSADAVSLAVLIIKHLQDKTNANAQALLKRDKSAEHVAIVAVNLLQLAKIPARIMHGIYLKDKIRFREQEKLSAMLAVYSNNSWHYINPRTGANFIPDNFFIWWQGDSDAMTLEGGKNLQLQFYLRPSIFNVTDLAGFYAKQTQSVLMNFSLLNLPVDVQQVYQILLMIPIGAFIIILLRSFIGLKTFGTFMPVLVALAFRETHLISGIGLFSLVVSLGLLIRFYLEHLKLLLVPRLGIVLSVVVILMVMLSILSQRLDLERGLSVALFPMVIMTMTIERMSLVWEERHPLEAIQQALGSLIAASLAYGVMFNRYIEHLFFVFPELLLSVMGVMVLLGHYRGYRLLELFRFKSFWARENV